MCLFSLRKTRKMGDVFVFGHNNVALQLLMYFVLASSAFAQVSLDAFLKNNPFLASYYYPLQQQPQQYTYPTYYSPVQFQPQYVPPSSAADPCAQYKIAAQKPNRKTTSPAITTTSKPRRIATTTTPKTTTTTTEQAEKNDSTKTLTASSSGNNAAIFSGTPLPQNSLFGAVNSVIEFGGVDFSVPQLRGWGTTKAGRFSASNVVGAGVFFRIIVRNCEFCEKDPNFMFERRFANGSCACTCCIPLYPQTNIPCKYCDNIQPRTVISYEDKLGEMCACYAWDIGWKPPRLDEKWNAHCGKPRPPGTGRRAAKKAMEDAGLKFEEPQPPEGSRAEDGVPLVLPTGNSVTQAQDSPPSAQDTGNDDDELPSPGEETGPRARQKHNKSAHAASHKKHETHEGKTNKLQHDVQALPASSSHLKKKSVQQAKRPSFLQNNFFANRHT